ncbi:MAG: hypothetical protein ACTS2F_10570 [Thainema sp.]
MTHDAITLILAIATGVALYSEWQRNQAESRSQEEAVRIPVRTDEHLPR